jgi:hypothetical protein
MRTDALKRVAAVSFLSVVGGGMAWAQGVSGGCTATINGRSPASLTAKDPFLVEKGQEVSVTGTVPASVANQRQVESETELKIFVGDLDGIPFETIEGTGPEWGGQAAVPDAVFDYAPGIYLIGGTASGTGGWSCEGSGYIEIAGGPWTAALAVGAGLTVVGALFLKMARGPVRSDKDERVRRAIDAKGGGGKGGLQDAMAGPKPPPGTGQEPGADQGIKGSLDAKDGKGASAALQETMGDKPGTGGPATGGTSTPPAGTKGAGTKGGGSKNALRSAMSDGRATHRLDALGIVAGAVPLALFLSGTVGSASALASVLVFAAVEADSSTRFWVRGRTFLGLVGGLLTGLGLALVLHQFDLWALSDTTFVYLPVALAVLGAIRGWWGRAYRLV